MKKFLKFLFFLPCLLQAQSFEGIIRLEAVNHTAGEEARIVWHLSAEGQRLDYDIKTVEGQGAFKIYFPKGDPNGYMAVEDKGEKRLHTISPNLMDPSNPAAQLFFARETGKRAPLGSFDAREVMIQGTKGYVQCWVAEVPGLSVQDFPQMLQGRGAIHALQAQNISGIPVDLIAFDPDGKMLYSQKILSVEPGKIPDSWVTLPKDFKKTN